jgi:UDP-GlcNAc:undecaprenyl-phosphate GlcNAc-1-phosphate transferase
LVFIIAFGVTFFLLPGLSPIARRIGLVDYPSRRKKHNGTKPLVGGIGIMAGSSLACLMIVPLSGLKGLFAGLVLLAFAGFLDDYKEISHSLKLLAQTAAVFFMVLLGDVALGSFGDLLGMGDIRLVHWAVPLTFFCTVGVINSINMIDGLDGLAGGVSFVAFASFAALSYINGQTDLMLFSIAFCGAVLAFLRYNLHPSRLFMGDAGSMALGFSLAFLSIAVTQWEGSSVPPVAPLLILAVPIVDTILIMTTRLLNGKSPFRADRSHLHHILVRLGFEDRAAVRMIVLISSVMSAIAIVGTLLEVPDYYLFLVFLVYFALHVRWSLHLRRLGMGSNANSPV